ncbi:hypothetical protein PYCC9005_005102 [Savitreella phatthalungensis]
MHKQGGSANVDVVLLPPLPTAPPRNMTGCIDAGAAIRCLTETLDRHPVKSVILESVHDFLPDDSFRQFDIILSPMKYPHLIAALSAYVSTLVYVLVGFRKLRLVRSRTGLAVGSLISTIVSCAAVWTPTVYGCPDRSPPLLIPFGVLVAETENLFRLTNAVTATPRTLVPARRVSEGLAKVGVITLSSQILNVVVCLGYGLIRRHIAVLCVQIALALVISLALHLTFFCAILAIDVRRTELMDLLAERHRRTSERFFPLSTSHAATAIILIFLIVLDLNAPGALRQRSLVSSLALPWDALSLHESALILQGGKMAKRVAVLRGASSSLLSLRGPLLIFGIVMSMTYALVTALANQGSKPISIEANEQIIHLEMVGGRALYVTLTGSLFLDGKHLERPSGRLPNRWRLDGDILVGWNLDCIHFWSPSLRSAPCKGVLDASSGQIAFRNGLLDVVTGKIESNMLRQAAYLTRWALYTDVLTVGDDTYQIECHGLLWIDSDRLLVRQSTGATLIMIDRKTTVEFVFDADLVIASDQGVWVDDGRLTIRFGLDGREVHRQKGKLVGEGCILADGGLYVGDDFIKLPRDALVPPPRSKFTHGAGVAYMNGREIVKVR